MAILRNTVLVAVIAGLLAGLALAAIQTFTTVPMILEAEAFEASGGAAVHEHAPGTPAHDHGPATVAPSEHHHDENAWAPADGAERTVYTFAANALTGIGFALLLVVVSELAGGIANWRQGAFWGLAGFATFTLAPGLGLPPELPAMPAADLVSRQIWWIGTVVATAAGLALIAFKGTVGWSLAGLALLVLPHAIGAPQPVDYASPVPERLHHDFVVASTVTNLVFWVILGGLVGVVRERWFGRTLDALQGRLA
jgi:cobalt transporter subunit CbtA